LPHTDECSISKILPSFLWQVAARELEEGFMQTVTRIIARVKDLHSSIENGRRKL
jgi:hypothetical protein